MPKKKKKKDTQDTGQTSSHLYDITDTLDKKILEPARLIKWISPKVTTVTLIADFSIPTKKPKEVE